MNLTDLDQTALLDPSNQATTGHEQSGLLAATGPRRIAWKRGSRKPYPAGAKLVTRTTRYGNPFRIIEHGGTYTRQESLRLYRLWLQGDRETVALAHADDPRWIGRPYGAELVALIRANLAGHDLVCTGCGKDEDCHGDIVLRVARGEEP